MAADADGAGTELLDNQLAARQRRPSTPVETIRQAREGSAPVREPDETNPAACWRSPRAEWQMLQTNGVVVVDGPSRTSTGELKFTLCAPCFGSAYADAGESNKMAEEPRDCDMDARSRSR